MPLEIQPKLLRLLQEREYERVGEAKIRRANVRVIAATNRDLKEAVARGAFRQDLLYRLDVISFRLPALRERPGDILAIAESELPALAAHTGSAVKRFSPAAREAMKRYGWPGNIRELRNVVERAVILAAGEEIERGDLPFSIDNETAARPFLGGRYSVEEIEAEHIREVLKRVGTLQEAAAILKLDPTTLLRKRKALGL